MQLLRGGPISLLIIRKKRIWNVFKSAVFPASGVGGAVLPLNNGLTLQYNTAQDDNIITFISFTNFPYQIQNTKYYITQRHKVSPR